MKSFFCLVLCIVGVFSLKPLSSLKPGTRIYNGELAKAEEFPWHAQLAVPVDNGYSICGGALISKKHVLSAAHCFLHAHHGNVSFGSAKWQKGKIVTFDRVSIHIDYKLCSFENDVAIVHLDEEVEPNGKTIKIIELDNTAVGEDEELLIAGFGFTSPSNDRTEDLIKTTLKSISNTKCKSEMPVTIFDEHLCAKGENGSRTCQGDSGGALVRVKDGVTKHVGIVSFGPTICNSMLQGVFMRTAKYIDWVNDHLIPY